MARCGRAAELALESLGASEYSQIDKACTRGWSHRYSCPMNPAGIDTSALLTMLGLIAAVWAVVPATSKLSFRLSLAPIDWVVIWGALAAIHAFFFEPVLRDLDLFPVIGPWRWGFDKSATQYLLFLLLAAFVFLRSRKTKLTRWNLALFDDLTTSLLHARKYEELGDLLQRHLNSALDLAQSTGVRSRLAERIRPKRPGFQVVLADDGSLSLASGTRANWFVRRWFGLREWIADLVGPSERVRRRAVIVVRRLLASRPLVAQLATSRPYLCIAVMDRATQLEDGFQDEFFEGLLGDEGSVLYAELKNNENFGDNGHRLALPDENQLLRFYCEDTQVARRLGVYRSVGNAVVARIDSDEALQRRLNGPLLSFDDTEKRRNPVHAGIWFFRIMILEGLHQGVADHLWLHYMPHFSSSLLAQARELEPDDENHEFATPVAYLLDEIVDTVADWIADAKDVAIGAEVVRAESRDGAHVYISFEATKAMGGVMQDILESDRLTQRLKSELFRTALTTLRDLEQRPNLAALATSMRSQLIKPGGWLESVDYLQTLKTFFDDQDHLLKMHLTRFRDDLDAARNSAL